MRKLLIIALLTIIALSLGYLVQNIITTKQGMRMIEKFHSIRRSDDKQLDELVADFSPKYYPVLYQSVRSPDPRERLFSAYILARRGKKDYVGVLELGLKSSDEREAQMATDLLWSLWFSEAGINSREILYNCKALMSQRRYDEAISKLTKLILRKPNFAEAYNQLALAYFLKGDYERSIIDCRQVLDLNPIHFGAQSGMGECYLHLNRYSEAKDAFEAALKITPHAIGTKSLLEQVNDVLQRRNKQFAMHLFTHFSA